MSIVRFSPWWEADRQETSAWFPPVDIWETPSAYRIDLEIPAVAAEAVDVSVEDGLLTVTGERQRADAGEDDRALRLERRCGRFSRRFRLPKNADAGAIEARVDQGVLALTVPKQAAHQPRRVEVVAA